MKRHMYLWTLAFVSTISAQALSQQTCPVTDQIDAQILEYDLSEIPNRQGFFVALVLGLEPESFPQKDIAEKKDPCSRGTFTVANDLFTVFGEDKSPPRWASSPGNPSEIIYLASMPRPKPAYEWYEKQLKDKSTVPRFDNKESMMYALVAIEGTKREIFALYDKMPSDRQLLPIMCTALGGTLGVQATFDVTTREFKADRSIGPPTSITDTTKASLCKALSP